MSNLQEKKNTNLLFYMEGCKTCNFFINTAHKANILKNFKMICIDGQKDKFKSQGLKKVPTIIIPSINKQFNGNECIKWLEDMMNIISNKNNIEMFNDELYIPDIGIVKNNSNNLFNDQISQLSNQISQLSTQINTSNQSTQNKSNQFEVPKTNIIKRNILNPIKPPSNSNTKSNTNSNSNPNSIPNVKPINQLFGYLQNEMSGLSDSYAYVNIDNPMPKSFLPPDKDMEIYTAPEGDKIEKKKQDQMIQLEVLERTNEKEFYKNSIEENNRKIAMGNHNLLPNWIDSKK
jgi:hypothetical protein